MSIQAYLENLVSTTRHPITFSGDVSAALSRWLVRSACADSPERWGAEPFLDTEARLLLFNETVLLPADEVERHWRMYMADLAERYLEVNTPHKLFAAADNKSIYCLCNVYCEQEREALVSVFTCVAAPIRVWINGELAVSGSHDNVLRDYLFLCKLREGGNTVLVETPTVLRVPAVQQEFIVKLQPLERLSEGLGELVDETLVDRCRSDLSLFPEKLLHAAGEELRLTVVPRICHNLPEKVRIRVYNDKDELIGQREAMTSTAADIRLDERAHGLLRITAECESDNTRTGQVHVFFGLFQEALESLLAPLALRRDLDPGVLTSARELQELPQAYRMLNQYVPGDVWQTLFQAYARLNVYRQVADGTRQRSHREVFGRRFTAFEPKPTGDGRTAYTVVLPDGYDESRQYPVVFYFSDAQVRSYPTELPWLRHDSTDEAILVQMIGIGGRLNFVDDVNVSRLLVAILDRYAVDRSRVYVIGFCTGAPKAYRIGCQLPDLFAGIASIVGDMRLSINDPEYEQIDNLSHTGVIGLISTEHWFYNSARKLNFLKRMPKARSWMCQGLMHPEFNAVLNSKKLLGQLLVHKKEPYPASVKLSPLTPSYNKAYWVQITEIDDLHKRSSLHAQRRDDGTLEISASNIASFRLLLPRGELQLAPRIRLGVNGVVCAVELDAYTQLDITLQPDGRWTLKRGLLTAAQFEAAYRAIGVDEERMGIQQVYVSACTVVKPPGAWEDKRSFVNKLAYLLQNPIKDRYIYYKYNSCCATEWDWLKQGDGHLIMPVDARSPGESQLAVLRELGLSLNAGQLTLEGRVFEGPYFAFIKCRHPLQPDRLVLVVAYNNECVEHELLLLMNAFETSPLFYNDAFVYDGAGYHEFRSTKHFLSKDESRYESKCVEGYC
ncbi:hypothetical protein B5M42_007375 [Paenibacillus athensensis]|uniref:Uncharacterized protein n=1 Tax=Paenibacillus athensensis TaxID=1967502 RepID=A0A4Y8Q382_9BACL|nr:hypothetical protein [Paenibacillus athensensis]MCD1258653.1 hypothetical protein [Paenibacillus athensensis]